jgi:mono/diheme cytochrome c family protein
LKIGAVRARTGRWLGLSPAPLALLPVFFAHAAQPSRPTDPRDRTVWQGVYSVSQAEQGRLAYERHCAACHGADLGGARTTALLGEPFMRGWAETNLYDLFDKIRTTMPPNLGRGLADDVYVDIVAYVLRENAFPAGASALMADADGLRHIRIQRLDGPAPVPSFALVRVVGCLQERVGDDWLLTRASEPVRARTPDASSDDVEAVSTGAAGTFTFRLFDLYPTPERDVGHDVEVKGFLIRTGPTDRINVTSLRPIADACRAPK